MVEVVAVPVPNDPEIPKILVPGAIVGDGAACPGGGRVRDRGLKRTFLSQHWGSSLSIVMTTPVAASGARWRILWKRESSSTLFATRRQPPLPSIAAPTEPYSTSTTQRKPMVAQRSIPGHMWRRRVRCKAGSSVDRRLACQESLEAFSQGPGRPGQERGELVHEASQLIRRVVRWQSIAEDFEVLLHEWEESARAVSSQVLADAFAQPADPVELPPPPSESEDPTAEGPPTRARAQQRRSMRRRPGPRGGPDL